MLFPNDRGLCEQSYAVEVTQYECEESDQLSQRWMSSKNKSFDIPINSRDLKLLTEAPAYPELKILQAKSAKKATVAGDILLAFYFMQRYGISEPSMNKAVFLSKEFSKQNTYGDGSRMDISEAQIRKCWGEYKPVAHFWTAFRLFKDYFLKMVVMFFPQRALIFSFKLLPEYIILELILSLSVQDPRNLS